MISVSYSERKASLEDILNHLNLTDESHSPRLSEKVDIPFYAKKIHDNAVTFEAWVDKELVGLVAAYLNQGKTGFITNVSVLNEFMGNGIANKLMQMTLDSAASIDSDAIVLEVSTDNVKAKALYKKCGFKELFDNNGFTEMKLEMGN